MILKELSIEKDGRSLYGSGTSSEYFEKEVTDSVLETDGYATDGVYLSPNGSRIGLTRNIGRQIDELVLKLVHTEPANKVHWYLEERFLQQTRNFHEIGVVPSEGKHQVTTVDALGNEV